MANDIVSIIMFNAIMSIQGKPFTADTPFLIIEQLLILAVVSIAIGLVFGFSTALLFKNFRFLNTSVVTETFIMIAMALMAYFIATMTVILGLEMSGMIALLVCGIIQAHYAWWNLSPQGKNTSSVTVSFLGQSAEAAVYSYIGISLYFTIPTWWSFSWIIAQSLIVILGRIVGVYGVFYFFRLFFKKKTITFWELSFITWGGMIRGAIAFALVMKIPYVGSENCHNPEYCYTKEQYDLAVSTCLVLVFVTTLIFGTFMKIYQKWALGADPSEHDPHAVRHHISDTASHYENLAHPNTEFEKDDPASKPTEDPNAPKGFNQSALYLWFVKYDEEVLRPFLIRKYDKILMMA